MGLGNRMSCWSAGGRREVTLSVNVTPPSAVHLVERLIITAMQAQSSKVRAKYFRIRQILAAGR